MSGVGTPSTGMFPGRIRPGNSPSENRSQGTVCPAPLFTWGDRFVTGSALPGILLVTTGIVYQHRYRDRRSKLFSAGASSLFVWRWKFCNDTYVVPFGRLDDFLSQWVPITKSGHIFIP